MSKPKDRQLMKELLKYPANVVFRDDFITVFQTNDQRAFLHYSEGCRSIQENEDEEQWIVRGRHGDVIVFRHEQWNEAIRIIGSSPARKDSDVGLAYYLQTYPSLYDVFGELAEKIHYLPLIRYQTDEHIMAALKEYPQHIKNVRNLSKKGLKKYIREYDSIVPHIPRQFWSSGIAHYIIDVHGGSMLHYVPDILRSPQLCMKAVRDWGPAIQHCPQQIEELSLAAVKKDGRALKYVKSPSLAVKHAAVKCHPDAWLYIKDGKERKKLKKMK